MPRILGAARFENDVALRTRIPGVATGLAWTPAGGDILFIESGRVRGSGKLILTGQLGDVMKESAQAAVTWVKSQADRLQIDPAALDNSDLHIHVPAGAIPKDGPGAGVRTVILPARNRRDLEEIPDSVRAKLEVVWAEKIDDVLARALEHAPAQRAAA